jgi:hypothetical protein
MNYFKLGERVQLKSNFVFNIQFRNSDETGLVIGYATLQSGVPCLILDMDNLDINGVYHHHLVVSMDHVRPF